MDERDWLVVKVDEKTEWISRTHIMSMTSADSYVTFLRLSDGRILRGNVDAHAIATGREIPSNAQWLWRDKIG